MKNRIRDVIRVGFRLIGLLMIAYGLFTFYQYWQFNQDISTVSNANVVTNLTKEEIRENNQKEVSYDASDVRVLTVDAFKNRPKIDPSTLPTIAGIAIPSINLNLPIYKGVSEENLMYGAGTLSPDQVMGERNYLLASHNMIQKGLLFGDVGKLKDGDLIYLTDLENIYVYKVYRNVIVSQYDIHELNDTSDPIVTLITCADSQALTRFIVNGSLEEVMPFDTAPQEILDYFNPKTQNNVWDEAIWGQRE